MKKATKWDASEFLSSEEDVTAYLNAALEDGDASVLVDALGDIARAKGMTQLAKETGVTRDGLYKALGFELSITAASPTSFWTPVAPTTSSAPRTTPATAMPCFRN